MAKPKFKIKHTITKKEWNKTHKDFKSIIDGVHYVMKLTDKGTALVPVNIEESVDENFAVHMAVAKAIKDAKVKNPDTKKDVKVTTALKDKEHPAHKQAKSLFQRIKDKVMGEGVISEVERGDMGYVEKHKSIATVYDVMSGGKKVRVKLGKTGKKVVIDINDIQILPESVNEAMVSPKSGHEFFILTKDTPIKYITGRYGMGLEVPGVLIKNKSGYIDGKKGAYIIVYFGEAFYVDMKKKFASSIYPMKDQDKLRWNSNFTDVDKAPAISDWKKYLKEDVNEAYIVTYAKKKGEKPASAAFQLRGSALSFERDLKKDGYITMVTQKKVKGIDESINEWKLQLDLGKVNPSEFENWASDSLQKKHKIKVSGSGKNWTIVGKGNDDRMGSSADWITQLLGKAWRTNKIKVTQKEAVKIKMNNLDWGKSTAERNANMDKYDSLKTDKEREAFLRKLKGESVNEGKDPEIITQLRDVVKNGYKTLKDPKSGKRMKVDTYSASAIVGVYDKLNSSNKEKFVKQGLLGMQSLAFKFIK